MHSKTKNKKTGWPTVLEFLEFLELFWNFFGFGNVLEKKSHFFSLVLEFRIFDERLLRLQHFRLSPVWISHLWENLFQFCRPCVLENSVGHPGKVVFLSLFWIFLCKVKKTWRSITIQIFRANGHVELFYEQWAPPGLTRIPKSPVWEEFKNLSFSFSLPQINSIEQSELHSLVDVFCNCVTLCSLWPHYMEFFIPLFQRHFTLHYIIHLNNTALKLGSHQCE